MNRINKLFTEGDQRKRKILSVYFTAGFPHLDSTAQIIENLEAAGADLIEIGLPFSDPLADGPVIQGSSELALKNGMNSLLLFEQLKEIRGKVKIPLIIMGYLNPVLRFGIEPFLDNCVRCGIDGLILPDLPLEQYQKSYRKHFEKRNLKFVFLVTPETSDQRIRKIDSLTDGFIYAVSSSSTTGVKSVKSETGKVYLDRLKSMSLTNPLLVGFGISKTADFDFVGKYSSGAIIGSAFINYLQKYGVTNFDNFVNEISVDSSL